MTGLLAQQPWYHLGQRDYAILVPFGLFMLGVAVITVLSHRYQKTGDFRSEYYVANRSFGWRSSTPDAHRFATGSWLAAQQWTA